MSVIGSQPYGPPVRRARAVRADLWDVHAHMESLCAEFSRHELVTCHLTVRPTPPMVSLGADLMEAVEAFAREALENVRQHAAATTVEVDVALKPERLRVSVRDNGRGICPARLQQAPDGGLRRAARLARAAGGSVVAEAPASGGTVLRLDLPVVRVP